MADLLAAKLSRITTISYGGTTFEAVYLASKGSVWVSNLGASPHLPVAVFSVAATLLATHGRILKGDATRGVLGSPALPLDSLEGGIAHAVFERVPGDAVFRRVTPIVGLLLHLRLAEFDGKGEYLAAPGMHVAPVVDARASSVAEVLHSGA